MKNFFCGLVLILTVLLFQKPAAGQGAPTVQDCLGAIPVCQPIYSTTASYTGHGNVYPEIHDNGVCPLCMDGEKNDVFYVFTVQTSGIFRFTLTPNNPNNDYDWSLFNMTNANCDDLYPMAAQLQVSCNSYGATGYNGPTGINTSQSNNKDCNGPGTIHGPAFNKDLNVLAGETYLLNISNWSSTNQEGYTLDFSSSTAQIFDNVAPFVDSIQQTISCAGSSTLYVRFSENIKCSDVEHHPEKFTVAAAENPYTVTDVTSADCDVGGTQTFYCILQVTPPLFGGDYDLGIIGDIGDLCNNLAAHQQYPFHLTELNAPVAHAGNDTTVPNGAIITLHGSATGGTGNYGWHWDPANLLVNANVQNPTTLNLGATTTFTLTVSDSIGCHGYDNMMVTVTGGPLGVNSASSPSTICAGESSQLSAVPTGGSGNYTYSWTSNPPGFTSDLANPVVYPVLTTTYTVQLFDGFTTVYGSTTVTVHPLPYDDAGSDVSIPYGTTTTLHGTASGASGIYDYHWTSTPPGFYSTQQNPVTPNLDMTTIFTLVATDNVTGCASLPSDVIVTVTGFALNVNPMAVFPTICVGSSTQLHALAGGGSGNYTFNWSSVPPGFSSTQQDPVVAPLQTTIYKVLVDDGFNQDTGSVTVHVNPVPYIHLGPSDTTICIFDSLTLDAGNAGAQYYWSNGSTERTVLVTTTGLTYDYQVYSVHVTNSFGCTDSATIHITFAFSACTGIHEQYRETDWKVFPNPAQSELNVEIEHPERSFVIQLTDPVGKVVMENKYEAISPATFRRTLNLEGISKGFYVVRLLSQAGWSSRKIIIY
ncbi:MAG TPA: T9SS type A sorting domain-containing protein [Bacteroidales bacterium]|nr:T9SS type A sorting domain-containing protein [Bacteroidales bacterium]